MVSNRLKDLETKPVSGRIKVFVKQEEHKTSKVEEGRYRLISAVSLIDTLVDRMLFPGLYDRAVRGAYSGSPIAVGWSFLRGGYNYVTDRISSPLAVDMSSWDWTVQSWMVVCYHDVFARLNVRPSVAWRNIWLNRCRALFKSEFQLPSGTVLRQRKYGIVKSGSWLTLLGNSILQLVVDNVINVRHPYCKRGFRYFMGDDTLKEDHLIPDAVYLDELRKLGLVAKMVERKFDFCGFDLQTVQPLYRGRHLWRLSHCDDEVFAETLQSYRLLYHRSNDVEMKKLLLDELVKCDPSLVWSDAMLDALVEGYE
ncbi:RNA-dependent RNA polymerase [Erysiphe necator associated luteo-like virus 1]|nr:RNA-dependent RNA polymerase [Erysiphe necator associated luteo-like virus 1]